MVFSIYSSLSRFNKKCSISQSTLRCGISGRPCGGTIKILVTGRANSEMENLENSQYWTQNLNSQNIQRINHFRTKSQYSPRSCRKFGGLRKIFLDHPQFLICFSNGLFKKWTDAPWGEKFELGSELWFWTWWRHRKVPEDITLRIIELIGRNGSKRLKNDL